MNRTCHHGLRGTPISSPDKLQTGKKTRKAAATALYIPWHCEKRFALLQVRHVCRGIAAAFQNHREDKDPADVQVVVCFELRLSESLVAASAGLRIHNRDLDAELSSCRC
jgi:hypothetical protein